MAVLVRRKKSKVEECDGAATPATPVTGPSPMTTVTSINGMGNPVPGGADKWDNIIGKPSTKKEAKKIIVK